MSGLPSVLVLGGGPDAERDVSVRSAAAVANALREAGHAVQERTLAGPAEFDAAGLPDALASMPGEVVFPVLHGSFGEGGPLQDVLEVDGRAYVGCGPAAARAAMDKVVSKEVAVAAGVPTAAWGVVDVARDACPVDLPAVVKPVDEGSSVGLMVCRDGEAWAAALGRLRSGEFGGRRFMAEAMVSGRECTVGLLADERGVLCALPIVEIVAASGVYDFDAKYVRGDTRYVVGPALPEGLAESMGAAALRVAEGIGVRHLSRADFLLDGAGRAWFLEINTMPGFTGSSLLPKAAAAAGVTLPALVSRLVVLAARDRGGAGSAAAGGAAASECS